MREIERRLEKLEKKVANQKHPNGEPPDQKGVGGKRSFSFIEFVIASSLALEEEQKKKDKML